MNEFSLIIKSKINEFKSTYRRELPKHIKEQLTIEEVEIKRSSIQNSSAISLYIKAQQLINHLENKQKNSTKSISYHQGIEKFIQQIKEILDEHTPYENTVIHKNKHSCEVLIRAIQIITLQNISLNYDHLIKLQQCCKTILELKNKVHFDKLIYAIKLNYKRNPVFFDKVINFCNKIEQD
ncbi:MAG: hypothetical protein VX335_03355 [Pseudomonadota bacterium]|nr:hypothetical protein [Pseudomonadota bacterium]